MSAQLTLLVDLDGVMADFEGQRFKVLKDRGLPAVPPADVTDFYGTQAYSTRFGKAGARAAREVTTEPGFFRNMRPIEGALEGFAKLESRGHIVRICSKPLEAHPNCTAEKVEWVREHLGRRHAERALIIKEKSKVEADALIDDRPDLYTYTIGRKEPEPVWKHVLYKQPWNRESTVHDFDMKDWSDFGWLDWLERLAQLSKGRRS